MPQGDPSSSECLEGEGAKFAIAARASQHSDRAVTEGECQMQMPAGLLYTKIIEAQNVPNMDWLSKTDAYMEIFIRGRRKRFTKVVWNSLNPRHAQIFQTDQLFLHCLWGNSQH